MKIFKDIINLFKTARKTDLILGILYVLLVLLGTQSPIRRGKLTAMTYIGVFIIFPWIYGFVEGSLRRQKEVEIALENGNEIPPETLKSAMEVLCYIMSALSALIVIVIPIVLLGIKLYEFCS